MRKITVWHSLSKDTYTDKSQGRYDMFIKEDGSLAIELTIHAQGYDMSTRDVAYYAPGEWYRAREE